MPREKKLSRSFGARTETSLPWASTVNFSAISAPCLPCGWRRTVVVGAGADGQRQVADEQLGLEVDGTRRVEAGLEGRAHGMSPFLGSGLMSVRAAQRTQPCTRLLEERLRPGAPGPNCGPGGIGGKPGIGGRRRRGGGADRVDDPRVERLAPARGELLGPDLEGLGQAQRDPGGLGTLVVE